MAAWRWASALVMGAAMVGCATTAAETEDEEAPSTDHIYVERKLVEVLSAAGTFNLLVTAIDAADLRDELSTEGPLTFLAPPDSAFQALPEGELERLLRPESKSELKSLLMNHVIEGRLDRTALLERTSVKSEGGQIWSVASTSTSLQIGEASVVQADVGARNGIIHILDAVLQR